MEHPGSASVGPGGRVGSADRPPPHKNNKSLKELRAGRVRGEDGTEERILGFWSILVLSVVVGCICCVFSWTLTYLDSYQPGKGFLSPRSLAHLRDEPGHRSQVGYGAVVLNGLMAMLTVFWILP